MAADISVADGEEKTLHGVILDMSRQISEISGKLDGLVSHEKLSNQLTDARRELITKIDKAEERCNKHADAALDKAVASTQSRLGTLEGSIDSRAEKVARRVIDEEAAKTEKSMKQAKLMMLGGGGMGLVGGATAVARLLFGGG